MEEQQKCVEAVLKSALVVNYEEEVPADATLGISSHTIKKVGWALEFENGIRLISKNQLVEVGAPYEIKYTISPTGAITNISAVPITEERDES